MGKKIKRKYSKSSGQKKNRRIARTIARLSMKIARWQRYVEEIKAGKRASSVSRWNVEGMKRHINLLTGFLK